VQGRNRRRGELVAAYRRRLQDIAGLSVPFAQWRGEPAFHIQPILLPESADRFAVMTAMKEAGIQTSIHYRPVDTFTAYVEAGLGPSPNVPMAHAIVDRVVTLPLYPSMSEGQVARVCAVLDSALRQFVSRT
jgi:dTDP-4-amino-4,6-dideoxygalactose transaminase